MSQEVSWYRKYRPRTFEEYEGDFIKSAVKRISDPTRRPQVMLLHGVYGCGKTTAARLLAGFYLCEALTEEGTPCGKCAGCQQLQGLIERGEDDGSSESIQEINGSEVNRIEDIRRIMNESMITLPSFSKYKIFIFDECHRITPEAQNALLKVLEDVPKHLVVIFATTEKEKMLPTVISRCQLVIEVRKQTVEGMTRILRKIAEKEGLTISSKALELIAKKCNRIPRDCINLLEDVAVTYNKKITVPNVLERIGAVDTDVYRKFMEASFKANTDNGLTTILTVTSELAESDISYASFLSGLSRYIMDSIYIRMGINLEEFDASAIAARKELFKFYTIDEFHKLLRLTHEAIHRSNIDTHTPDLALSVLAMNIGSITNLQETVQADKVQVQAKAENSEGSKKFVERDIEKRLEDNAPKKELSMADELNEFLISIGSVQVRQEKF